MIKINQEFCNLIIIINNYLKILILEKDNFWI